MPNLKTLKEEDEFNVLTSNYDSCMYPSCGACSYQITINESGYMVPCIQLSFPEFYMGHYYDLKKFINTTHEQEFINLMQKNKEKFAKYCEYMDDIK